jgi:predicted dehydrogenase
MPRISRRTFNQLAGITGAGYFAGHGFHGFASVARAEGPNDKLSIAVIGTGGQGGTNLKAVSGQNIVALCDVDERRAGKAFEAFNAAKKFTDFRKMFDTVGNQIDAVVISTPDHTHFHPAWWAMERGKHVYLEKPLAHEVEEVHRLTDAAREKKLATQLGAQRHALKGLREAVAIVKSGAIGDVGEVHSWIGTARGMPKLPGPPESVPAGLDWDLWLGPNAERPYTKGFAPYDWRFWWEFGTGETGNWGCHILDIPFWALDLAHPIRVAASGGPEPDKDRTPTSLTSRLDFPARGSLPPVSLHWYQGVPEIAKQKIPGKNSFNTLFMGEKGMLACGFDKWKLLPEGSFQDYKGPDPALPPSPGFHQEWIDACRGGTPASCNFDYAGPMAESVLLANIAYRVQREFDWDAPAMKASREDATALLRREYRKGWEV